MVKIGPAPGIIDFLLYSENFKKNLKNHKG